MKHQNPLRFICRATSWIGRNLVLTTIIVTGVIALWPTNNHIYRTNSQATYDMDFAMGESIEMAPMAMTRGNLGGMAKMMMPTPAFADDFAPEETERKIIRRASLQVEVKDTEVSRKETEKITKEYEGHITNMNSYEVRPHTLSYNFTVRIPSQKLDSALEKFTALGIKKSESINEDDITAQYTDTANRIKNLETRRDRLRELMESETDNLGDVLSIDRELSSVQQQIENYQRNLKQHDTNVAYSTINLSLQPEPEIGDFTTPEWTPKKSWKQSVNDLIVSLQDILDGAIQILVFAPIWLPILIVIWIIQRLIRRRQNKCMFKIKK